MLTCCLLLWSQILFGIYFSFEFVFIFGLVFISEVVSIFRFSFISEIVFYNWLFYTEKKAAAPRIGVEFCHVSIKAIISSLATGCPTKHYPPSISFIFPLQKCVEELSLTFFKSTFNSYFKNIMLFNPSLKIGRVMARSK